jgi:dienelactone hydrolase
VVAIEEIVDGIPVLLVVPDRTHGRELVLWMSHLGGSAEQTRPMLERLAAAGHPAVSFDPPGHGRRADGGDPRELARWVLGAFRRRMWPLLGQTTLESLRVVSWAMGQTDASGPIRAGGVSMGGDAAVALVGIDPRIDRVATVGSTPNWDRPDMRGIDDPETVLDQGESDPYAQWYADQLDPRRHLERYEGGVAISFELGGADHHIPAENAREFREALTPAAQDRIRIQIHSGLDHFGVVRSDAALGAAVACLTDREPA